MTKLRTIPPSTLAVTLAQAKQSLRIDDSDMDDLVTTWLMGVIADAESLTGQCLMQQTWEVRLDAFDGAISLPHPVIGVTSIKYLDTAGVEQTLVPAKYRIKRGRYESTVSPVTGTDWPDTLDETHAVTVTVVCGFGDDPTATPPEFRLYITAKLAEQFDPATRTERDTVQSSYLDGLLDKCKCYS